MQLNKDHPSQERKLFFLDSPKVENAKYHEKLLWIMWQFK